MLRPPGFLLLLGLSACAAAEGGDWPRWRGADGSGVSEEAAPLAGSVAWTAQVPGEGSSSPILWGDRIFLTSSLDDGTRRLLHGLDRKSGRTLWTRETKDANPEVTSALTGHAAATPATDGRRVVAFFGNAGAVCTDVEGALLWTWKPGEFESELGFASSPVFYKDCVLLVCDHDGDRARSFDSFLIALDAATGAPRWKTERSGLGRSWSTPILVESEGRTRLVVSAQDELRAYDPETGALLWQVRGTTGWVTPSPVFGDGLIFAVSGKDGPTIAVRPDGTLAWRDERGGPYVCSPLFYRGLLYVHDEQGRLTCREASSGRILYRTRLEGRFIASAVAADGRIYFCSDEGTIFVVRAGEAFELLAENRLGEELIASPAVSGGALFLRTRKRLYRLE